MRFARDDAPVDRFRAQVAPMIDVVFLLLIFFMLTLKIIEPEGDFTLHIPTGSVAAAAEADEPPTVLHLHLRARDDGTLSQIGFGRTAIAIPPAADAERREAVERAAFARVRGLARKFVETAPGGRAEAVIHADYQLHSGYTLNALSALAKEGVVDETGRRTARPLMKRVRLQRSTPMQPRSN